MLNGSEATRSPVSSPAQPSPGGPACPGAGAAPPCAGSPPTQPALVHAPHPVLRPGTLHRDFQ